MTIGFEATIYEVNETDGTVEVCARVLEGSLNTSVVTSVESMDGSAEGQNVHSSHRVWKK